MKSIDSPGRTWPFRDWCDYRGISYTTGWRLVNDNELTTFKVRGRRFVSERADREFINRLEQRASA